MPRVGYRFVARLSAAPAEDVSDSPLPTHDISAIAVLPFADMSPARDQDYLSEGLAEELINAVTHIDGLRVAARTASFQFRGTARTFARSAGILVSEHCSKAAVIFFPVQLLLSATVFDVGWAQNRAQTL